jgi:hypothetical protein
VFRFKVTTTLRQLIGYTGWGFPFYEYTIIERIGWTQPPRVVRESILPLDKTGRFTSGFG